MVPTFKEMNREERQEAFMQHVVSSTFGQRLTESVAQMIAMLAKEEMHQIPDDLTQELALLSDLLF